MGQSIHRLSKTKIYALFITMKMRCYNINNHKYKNYGGRGIKICDEWLNDFMSFYNWAIENGYNDGLSIDRINNNGNYEPSNCRWVDAKIQSNNRTNNHLITYNNETHTLSEWCDKLNLNYSRTKKRLYSNWSVEKSFSKPKMKNQYI